MEMEVYGFNEPSAIDKACEKAREVLHAKGGTATISKVTPF